ncbi:MAG: helicase-related protein, partial [Oceanisphaera sp.]|nr:helicase-related protein [Oceanisphaera sp.]
GDKSQGARTRALSQFKEGKLRVLVATDIAARGIDISELPHVVNYELPHVAEDYVHRIGRTGRAGSQGEAMSLICFEEKPLLKAIERLTKQTAELEIMPGYEPLPDSQQPPIEKPAANNRGRGNAGRGNGNGRGQNPRGANNKAPRNNRPNQPQRHGRHDD